MATPYGYSLDGEAVTLLLQCPARERRLLVAAFEQLARYPGSRGDFHHRGRTIVNARSSRSGTLSSRAGPTMREDGRILLIERV